ncbi:hypothetical protein QVD17_23372 [Tagetes erecta]|uniref:Uncharacterized protein n=1 Tax=Tagetes erecta TaxID=13708 RepID=A0AAD8NU06_TARER|nr:hypothetical protein QVD17_23372 [Tagetes erecta]
MVLGLKSHFHTHPISSFPNQKPQTILNPFKFKPIQTHNFSQLQLKSKNINPNSRLKSSASSEVSINSGDGGGGGVEGPRKDTDGNGDRNRNGDKVRWFVLRWIELLIRADRKNVMVVGLPETMGWMCAQAAWEMYLMMVEIMVGIDRFFHFIGYACVGVVIFTLSAIIFWL